MGCASDLIAMLGTLKKIRGKKALTGHKEIKNLTHVPSAYTVEKFS